MRTQPNVPQAFLSALQNAAVCGPKCGTVAGYIQTIREDRVCPRCRQAKAAHERQRRGLRDILPAVKMFKELELLAFYVELRPYMSLTEIAGRFGISRGALSRKLKALGITRKAPRPHGSLRRYRDGCRCERCCAANAQHVARWRESKRDKVIH